ncbi:MAG: protein DA1 [Candidatus Zixiibacteriota bacterium]|nr:MAG: protein DA1 [candidate division Zixibacteria bacterium]
MMLPRFRTNYRAHSLTVCLIVLLVVAVSTAVAGNEICDRCGKKITDSHWIEFENRYFHTHHFTCDNCGGDLREGSVYSEGERMYDSACYYELFVPKCDHCGEPIQGKYTEFESKLYHLNCYEQNIGPRCAICDKAIYGNYFIDPRGNSTCASHLDEYPTCDYCGSYIAVRLTGRGEMYSDGRKVCGLCRETAVDDTREARVILEDVLRLLAGYGIEMDEDDIPLELVDRYTIRRKSEGFHDDPSGFTSYEKISVVPGVWTRRDFKVYVLEGMPRAEFIFTLAHELMHVWLFKNTPEDMRPILIEGSCQYAAILVILKRSEEQTGLVYRRAMEDEDPIYGDGLRKVDHYVERVGVPAWLDYLKGHTDTPW